jgi:phosphate transport system substrate-binding protein
LRRRRYSPTRLSLIYRVGGTGMALKAMRVLSDDFSAIVPTTRLEILRSLGTSGGIRALAEGAIDIALSARERTPQESAKGVQKAACFRTAMVFASSDPSPSGIALADLPDLYRSVDRKWPDGMPIKVILRSRSGSENEYIVDANPAMAGAIEEALKRSGTPAGSTDQLNAELAMQTAGSLALMTLLQVRAEHLNLQMLPIDGNAPTLEALDDNTYPLPINICLLTMRTRPPAVSLFLGYFWSAAARDRLRTLGAIPYN